MVGINNNGTRFRDLLEQAIQLVDCDIQIVNVDLKINPAHPTTSPISLNVDKKNLVKKNVLLIDDVANTGRTLFYAATFFNDILLTSLKTGVLVDRKHKSFPIHVDFVGMTLATTMKDDIDVGLQLDHDWYAQVI
jgi:pyrimidine operon attenuation protein/uracil phosphoribosyltransferase